MQFLSIVWYKVLPPKYGGQKGIAFFNKYLSLKKTLICLCSNNNEPSQEINYKILPLLPVDKLQFLNPFCWIKILNIANKYNVTHIILEHPYYGIAGFIAKYFQKKKLIVHSHNIEYLRFRDQNKWWWRLLYFFEKWTHRQADLSLFKTEKDRDHALEKFAIAKAKTLIIPYCIETPLPYSKKEAKQKIYEAHNIDDNARLFLFAGTLDYLPNANAVEAIYKYILPQLEPRLELNFKILICGRNKLPQYQYLKALKNDHAMYIGEVENIDEYMEAADAFINPVTEIAGIQTKIIDALSFHKKTIVFNNAIEGIPKEVCGDNLIIINNHQWTAFVDAMVKMSYENSETPPSFFEYFSWKKAIEKLEEKLK